MPRDLTVGDIAEKLAVSRRTVSKWIDTGLLPGYRLPGSQHRRVQRHSLLDFLKHHDLPVALMADSNEPASV